MARYTVRYTKKGPRITTRTKIGNTTVTRTTGAGKKPRTTMTTRGRTSTWSKTL